MTDIAIRVENLSKQYRFSKARIHSLGWEAKVSLKACPEHSRRKGIALTYLWIEAQVKAVRDAE